MNLTWTRAPQSPAEHRLVKRYHDDALGYLRSFRDPAVSNVYKGTKNTQRLLTVQTPMILGAIDAHEAGEYLMMDEGAVPSQLLEIHEADWDYIGNAINALYAADVVHFGPECREGAYQFTLTPRVAEDLRKAVQSNNLNYSRPLDVHTWSEHPEVNPFVDHVFSMVPDWSGNKAINKKHLKTLLLHLYVVWLEDPPKYTVLQRGHDAYAANSRYNSLHISSKMPQVVDWLVETGLLETHPGFHDRRPGGQSKASRIRPTEALIQMFKDVRFGPLDIGHHEERECIVLRDIDQKTGKAIEVEYDDTEATWAMRRDLTAYNKLLKDCYIDIPSLETNFIDLGLDINGNPARIMVNQRDKFVRRIFNRGSWNKGGRFWGGWWQRCPKAWRRFDPHTGHPGIFINDKPTIEIDYSGLHMVMLYAQQGIDYWTDIGADPYAIELPEGIGLEVTPEELRDLCKTLVLMAINARDDKATFKAFRQDAEPGSPEKSLKDKQLGVILQALKDRHSPIADKFASDQGIDLMRKDSEITARIINHFTAQGIPILTLHDSYIINDGSEYQLEKVMQKAFEQVTGITQVKLKAESSASGDMVDAYNDALSETPEDYPKIRATLLMGLAQRSDPPRTQRYLSQLEEFRKWKGESLG